MILKQIKKISQEVVNLEIKALKQLKYSINFLEFSKAVKKIIECKSKIILCGVGKSGFIANKIAATLSSVGNPAFVISASDCSHGDLGSISKKDVLIIISNSGNSDELKNIIKFANRNKITLIGIVTKKNSILYNASDIKLVTPNVKESGFGIVPTSSTTAQLCLGDALAITSMHYKKFSKLDFKKFHPSGSLGKKLTTVEDLMINVDKIPFVSPNIFLRNAIKLITKKNLGLLVIRDTKGLTKGICTDGDVKRALNKYPNIENIKVSKIMTKKPIFIDKNELAAKAIAVMNQKKITHLLVKNKDKKNKTVGLIHIHDLLKANVV